MHWATKMKKSACKIDEIEFIDGLDGAKSTCLNLWTFDHLK